MDDSTQQKHTAEPKAARNRSFGGCTTCRRRHVKCDEGYPSCNICRSLNLPCEGYRKSIFFDFDEPHDGGGSRFRRPLFTEQERMCMSEWLVSSIKSKSALWHIAQIDDECEKLSAVEGLQYRHGPFGVFKLDRGRETSGLDARSEAPVSCSFGLEAAYTEPINPISNPFLDQLTFSLDQTPPENREHVYAPHSPQFWDALFDSEPIQDLFDVVSMPDADVYLNASPGSQGSASAKLVLDLPSDHTLPPKLSPNVTNTSTSLPHDSVFLLKHYSSTIPSLVTPFQHSKTPWHILFIPHGRNCLAAFTLGEHLDSASLAIFYGMLSISAYSLGRIHRSDLWCGKAASFMQQARDHAQLIIDVAYGNTKAAKYKSILMALITMVQVSMFAGNRNQSECYFLEAEKFIRLKGLKRRKSRKVRLLHHCYAFERILYESTSISQSDSAHRHRVRRAVESSGMIIHSHDSLSFRLSDWTHLDLKTLKEKGQEEGENDLHLEVPGAWTPTLYPEIFGVSEQWLMLVSLVVRLGKEKDAAEKEGTIGSLSLKEFLTRAKAIERCINQLQLPDHVSDSGSDFSGTESPLVVSMLSAMQGALSIYFYRRIFDVDASLLQPKVRQVYECVIRHRPEESGSSAGAARFIWPAFISACEAEDTDIQTSFADWFRCATENTGLQAFADSLESIQRVWDERKLTGESVSWVNVMTRRGVNDDYALHVRA